MSDNAVSPATLDDIKTERIIAHMNRKRDSKAYIARYEDLGQGLTQGPEPEDLINSVESRFGIVISDEEAEEIRTPAQLIDLILTKIETREPGECMGQRAFHLIRRAAVRSFGLQRRSISPASRLDEIVPQKLRYARWKGFGTNIRASTWPELKRSRSAFALLAVLTLAVFVFVSSQLSETGVLNVLLSSAMTIGFAIGLSWITRPLKRVFPLSCLTVADLSDWIVAENPQLIRHEGTEWTRERVAATVRRLVVEWSNERDFTEESLFYPTRMIT